MNEREAAVHFYEMLTGVFDDNESKIVRIICFAVLFLGMIWAGFHYFRATVLANTEQPLDPDMFQDVAMPGNDAALKRIVDLAQTVDSMRSAGTTIAQTLEGIHNLPFNVNPEGGELDPFGNDSANTPDSTVPSTVASGTQTQQNAHSPLSVRMIMTADDGQKIAVVDGGGKKAVVLRRGDEIPGGGGFVSSIRPDGITVIINKQEVKYDVPEIPKYNDFKTSKTGRK
ncbi:MAG: hypothetical protein IJ587_07860 [Synergistaceae bacterium]|nr:hypothetical protein [Synergistaceae bacterium]